MIGVFGYATFLGPPNSTELCHQNILEADYKGSKPVELSNIALLLAMISTAPLDLLPCKNSIEEMFFKEKGMSSKENFMVTFALVTLSAAFALFIDSIGDAMTLIGNTINPIVGFILPIYFWLPFIEDQPWYSSEKLKCYITAIVVMAVSVLSLIEFFSESVNDC